MQRDDVIGSGMAGLVVASLLTHQGRRAAALEAHDKPGGYAHIPFLGQFPVCAYEHDVFAFLCDSGATRCLLSTPRSRGL